MPAILTREPLTRKAESAINKYLAVRRGSNPMYSVLAVKYVLQAERMRRADLYAYLEGKGYKWISAYGIWSKD